MNARRVFVLSFALGLLATAPAAAELPPLSPEERLERATCVVTGEVKAVYSTEKETKKGFTDRLFLLEVMPATVEKGDGPKRGEVFYVRCWKRKDRPAGWVGPGGQTRVPAARDRVRLFIKRAEDGGYDLLIPNGVEFLGE
jgi:hypothetical protein